MNRTRLTGGMCVLALLSLAACADWGNKSDSGRRDATGAAYAPSSNAMTGAGAASQQADTRYGVVQAIDQLQRQDTSAMGAVGAAAAGGAAAGSPTDKVYRVTLRLDDGSTHMVVLESEPTYKIGDRVRYGNGSVQTY